MTARVEFIPSIQKNFFGVYIQLFYASFVVLPHCFLERRCEGECFVERFYGSVRTCLGLASSHAYEIFTAIFVFLRFLCVFVAEVLCRHI